MKNPDTICAIASPRGVGAISIIRISGPESFQIANKLERKEARSFTKRETKLTNIYRGDELVDNSVVIYSPSPNSYTGEDSVEILCHGSIYIQKSIVEAIVELGARVALPGEFSQRAFLNGKMDLLQAEAVAELISANTKAAHKVAMNQMRGGFSHDLKELRSKLIELTALMELELDFSEEDVEFADKKQMNDLLQNIQNEVIRLKDSFSLGNVIKNGIPIAIVGRPNVGKSTLLNTLLNEDRAIVSDIPGTTRDALEDTVVWNGVTFRFIDTAGLRDTSDVIESMGIDVTYKKIEQSDIILYLVDITETDYEEIVAELEEFKKEVDCSEKKFIVLANKIDKLNKTPQHFRELVDLEAIYLSAKRKENIDLLKDRIVESVNYNAETEDTILINARHFNALNSAEKSLSEAKEALMASIPADLILIDIRQVLHHIGSITGEVSTDDVLDNIFRNFCIGK